MLAIHALRAKGVKVYCMETTDDAVSYADLEFAPEGVALVLGNEVQPILTFRNSVVLRSVIHRPVIFTGL